MSQPQDSFEFQHAKVVRLEVSIGKEDAGRDLDEFIAAIRAALEKNKSVRAQHITVMGSYYIIDGKVCAAADYDPETRNRRPGTYPPQWAGGPTEAQRRSREQFGASAEPDEPGEEREFVRVTPTRSSERDPRTGRRIRSDKGVPRGPKKTVDVKSAVAEMGKQILEGQS